MKKLIYWIIEILLVPITVISAIMMRYLTMRGIHFTLISEKIFMFFEVLPIRDHYYQPLINPKKHLRKPLNKNRILSGIDFNDSIQLEILDAFNYNDELLEIPINNPNSEEPSFYFNNISFESGDAEYLYSIIRYFKPKQLIEIGSGFSSLLSLLAFEKNSVENKNYACQHICIEPFEQNWLEKTTSKIIRENVESLDIKLFESLSANDILFIDSSHIIRPQGDVLFEIQEILPRLKSGVLVHFHDIFSPKDYPHDWIFSEHRMWNEQYLLEAFLSENSNYEIIGAVNYLLHNHNEQLISKCPILRKQHNREPGSFWIRRK